MFRTLALFSLVLFAGITAKAQSQMLDEVIAVVGKYPVLLSDLQSAMLEREKQGLPTDACPTFEALVYQKLLIAQADRDSVTVEDAEVDRELAQRMAYFIQQFGSEEKLEAFYGKRVNVIKDELRADVSEQLLAQKMIGKINGESKLTPSEVRSFYNSVPKDSLPLISSEVELQQITMKPVFSPEAKQLAKETLEGYRQRVLNGEKMSTLARLYSEDPGSAAEGGLIGNVARGLYDPAFEAVAFSLKTGEVSKVFESSFGFHFIQLIQRKGDLVDLRHILVMPKMTNADFFRCKQRLDSVYAEITEGRISFEDAAKKFSDDDNTRQNGGLMINPQTASTRFSNDDLVQGDDDKLIVTLNSMQPGDISKPMQFLGFDRKPGFRIIRLKNRIDPHKANLRDDYQKLSAMAGEERNIRLRKEWIKKRSKITYIKIDPEYAGCRFDSNWTISN